VQYRWDDFRLDLDAYRLVRGTDVLSVEPKALDLLALLVTAPGHLFTKQEIFDAVWPDTAVTDHALTRVVAQLRRVLGDDPREPRYIETVPTRGYRWLCAVTLDGPLADPWATLVAADPAVPTGQTLEGPDVETLAGRPSEDTPPSPRTRRWPVWSMWAAGLLAGVLGVGVWGPRTQSGSPARAAGDDETAVRPQNPPWPVQVTTHDGLDLHPALSPRGDALAFSSDRSGALEIYVRPLADGATDRALTGDRGHNVQPVWAPDGARLAYHSSVRGGVWIIPAHGGIPRQVAPEGSNPSWSPDSRRIVFQTDEHADVTPSAFGAQSGSTVWVVDADGSNRQPLTRPGKPIGGHAAPVWSPDGRYIGFTVFEGGANNGVWLLSLASGDVTPLARASGLYEVVFAPNGSAIYAAGGDALIHRLPFDAERGIVTGPREVIPVPGVPGVRGLSVSSDGARLAFAGLGLTSQIWSQPIKADGSAAGAAHPLTTDTSRRNSMAVVSPDGARVAYTSTRQGEPPNVWVMDVDGANRVQVTMNETSDGKPSWFPDSRRVAYFTNRGESYGLWSVDVATRREEPLLDMGGRARGEFVHGWLAEFELSPSITRGVFAVVSPPDGRRTLFISPLEAFEPARLTDPAHWIGYPAWSPDERQIAAELKDGSSTHLVVVDARTGAHRQITGERGQTWVRSWSPDGAKVAIAAFRGGQWSLRWVEVATGRQGVITPPGPPHVYERYPEWSRRNDVVVFERGELRGNIWTMAVR
jgi:Tol biopolymer transport system component/DNA-binding winged helix-turn-helix (wHTH) protein